MNTKRNWHLAVAPFALAAIVAPAVACDKIEEAQGAVCCKEFQVGGTITAEVGGTAQSVVAVQAVADFAGIASVAIDDLTTACRNIAQDLDAPKVDQDAAEANPDKRDKMNAWCGLAVTAIGSVKASAGGTLQLVATAPKCEASVSAKANCQASCSGSASCDLKANPPVCEGGSLEVSCKGSCTAKAGAKLTCEGACTGECKGECTAMGGVQCAGRCEGTCAAGGIQPDGTCMGVCNGTCKATAPAATCDGSCKGECAVSCDGGAMASVKCDGECAGEFEPLKCTGGELKGGCQVEAKCDANCDASVKAKASCTPPSVTIAFTGATNIDAVGKLKATLEANLGVVLAFKSRLEGMGEVVGTISGNVEAVVDIKAACIPAMVAAIGTAVEDLGAAGEATISVAGSVGG